MSHFAAERWADFVRNTLEEDAKAKMQAHIETGCKECRATLKFWTRVSGVMSSELDYQPSQESVRIAKSYFAVRKPGKSRIADLLFDSVRTPALAGVRGSAPVSRQLLYAAGAYRIDLRLEPQLDSDAVFILGQVLNSADPSQMVIGMPVSLVKNRKKITSSQTGPFGEFQMECKLRERLQLKLALPDGVGIEIPLLEPSKAAVTGEVQPGMESRRKANLRQSTSQKV